MKEIICSICLGYDIDNLKGCSNDAKMYYNYILKLKDDHNMNEIWLEPKILLNKNVIEDSIIKIISEMSGKFDKLLIIYSGHGFMNGNIGINSTDSNFVSDIHFLKNINNALKNPIDLYIILDCCYSGSFKLVPYKNFNNISLIGSTLYNQSSNESSNLINNVNSELTKNLVIFDKSITTGVFTYNFITQLHKKKYKSINQWGEFIFDRIFKPIWNSIEQIANQTPKIIW
jgi:hypothetical protein|uniref:Peptidase C14 caspase domain-containing protein n=1 Tax=viral metagenome TaxID=1070528 RepID=A0A6C0ITL5_9ZZZZ